MSKTLKYTIILAALATLPAMPLRWVGPGPAAHADPAFTRGDANDDGIITLADALYVARYLYAHGPEPLPEVESGDARCDGRVNILDAVFLINHVLRGGPAPKCPTG